MKIDKTLIQSKTPELHSTGVWDLRFTEREERGGPRWLAHSPSVHSFNK